MNRKDFTLNWVNGVRKALGKKPLLSLPKGTPLSPTRCPVGIALGADVGGADLVGIHRGNIHLYIRGIPSTVLKFIKAFDEGKYPELEKS